MSNNVDFTKCNLHDLMCIAQEVELNAHFVLSNAEISVQCQTMEYAQYHDIFKTWKCAHKLNALIKHFFKLNAYGAKFMEGQDDEEPFILGDHKCIPFDKKDIYNASYVMEEDIQDVPFGPVLEEELN